MKAVPESGDEPLLSLAGAQVQGAQSDAAAGAADAVQKLLQLDHMLTLPTWYIQLLKKKKRSYLVKCGRLSDDPDLRSPEGEPRSLGRQEGKRVQHADDPEAGDI